MVLAIIAVTLLVRVVLIPLYRKQIVSQKRMQLLAPELKEIQKRYKGDRVKLQEATQAFYKERGVNPAQGCLPLVLQFMLLIPMYSVFSSGLQNTDPNGMLRVFGIQVITLDCPPSQYNAAGHVIPCINSTISLFGYSIDLSQPSVLFTIGIGISILAIISSLLQLFQSRMTLPRRDPNTPDDQNTKIQRQSMLFLPFISIFYGGFLPAGLFIYWIVSTLFSIVQQYLIIGWGGMFPLFGWDPPLPETTSRASRWRSPPRIRANERQIRCSINRRPCGKSCDDHPSPRTGRPTGPTRETTLTMSAYQEFTGKSVEEALKAAREAFGVGLNDLDFEILTPGQPGRPGHGRRAGPDRGRAARRARRQRTEARRSRRHAHCRRPPATTGRATTARRAAIVPARTAVARLVATTVRSSGPRWPHAAAARYRSPPAGRGAALRSRRPGPTARATIVRARDDRAAIATGRPARTAIATGRPAGRPRPT